MRENEASGASDTEFQCLRMALVWLIRHSLGPHSREENHVEE